ncbi:NADP-dependent oxidoreductase domain-containing protein [Phascolomyces articulosus]|uniref:NADP-dependent oxidoreductase domain-containing protein n=1 Tax=Phascolomyces articulosus TaxID=60185 RepID=A0AAD5KBB3_9FUNG|nr:NADP-dependent oxidoreductase domain-containing protein [Phascolomyces articulosus]
MVFELNTGATIPAVGLGTWKSLPGDVAYNTAMTAIKAGLRVLINIVPLPSVIDNNEKEIGRAIKDCGVPRGELFITTKLWNTCHRPELVVKAFKGLLD